MNAPLQLPTLTLPSDQDASGRTLGAEELALLADAVQSGTLTSTRGAFVKALQRLVPEIRSEHLMPAPAGIRAQAIAPNGAMVDDFLIQGTDRVVNVCNAPSPAATASLNIGMLITDALAKRF